MRGIPRLSAPRVFAAIPKNARVFSVTLVSVIVLAVVASVVGGQIRSPAQVAADTAAPQASLVSVPVERRALATEVIVRGTVRFGSPQAVVLPTSVVKTGSEVISQAPRRGARLGEGSIALSVSGRPVFVLGGAYPMYRDLGPATEGADVLQLEQALRRIGLNPGTVDGRYDGSTARAVAAMYARGRRAPFGVTDAQAEQLRTAEGAAAAAEDAFLQTRLALRIAARGTPRADINQARLDAAAADSAVPVARGATAGATAKVDAATDAMAAATRGKAVAQADARRDRAVASADLATKRAALSTALDDEAEAQRQLNSAPPESAPGEREALKAKLRQTAEAVTVLRGDVDAAQAAADAVNVAASRAIDQASADAKAASRDRDLAKAELRQARDVLTAAERTRRLAHDRVRILGVKPGTTIERQIQQAAAREVRRLRADVARLAVRTGVQVPANEVLFFPTLPLRIDAVKAKRGDQLSGRVMTVTNSRLAVDAGISAGDARLVRPGMRVLIEEQDLGIKIGGRVKRVADKPGTNGVDPQRTYLEVAPERAPATLVGASVKLSIAIESTKGKVLAVPVSALSVVADGTSRVQVDVGSGKTRFVTVVPGLAADGFAEVRAVGGSLNVGDRVVVGAGPAAAQVAPTGTPPAKRPSATTPVGAGAAPSAAGTPTKPSGAPGGP